MRRAVGVEAVDAERENRDIALGRSRAGDEIGLGDLADEQTGGLVDPEAARRSPQVDSELQQLALARLPAVELGLDPQRRADAGDQLDAVDRLGDVVGGAGDEGVGRVSMSSRAVTMIIGTSA